jgi:uncharacterized protein YdhG (YjbR/CyaY superfamily)
MMKSSTTSAKRTRATRGAGTVWTDEERAAMQEGARERKAASRRDPAAARAEGERDLLAKIAEMPPPDRAMAERIHEIVMRAASDLAPRTWYGMPAYADADGKVICFFTPAGKFKERYASFGFQPAARLDDGTMWPTSWALTKLSAADEKRIAELVKKAVG